MPAHVDKSPAPKAVHQAKPRAPKPEGSGQAQFVDLREETAQLKTLQELAKAFSANTKAVQLQALSEYRTEPIRAKQVDLRTTTIPISQNSTVVQREEFYHAQSGEAMAGELYKGRTHSKPTDLKGDDIFDEKLKNLSSEDNLLIHAHGSSEGQIVWRKKGLGAHQEKEFISGQDFAEDLLARGLKENQEAGSLEIASCYGAGSRPKWKDGSLIPKDTLLFQMAVKLYTAQKFGLTIKAYVGETRILNEPNDEYAVFYSGADHSDEKQGDETKPKPERRSGRLNEQVKQHGKSANMTKQWWVTIILSEQEPFFNLDYGKNIKSLKSFKQLRRKWENQFKETLQDQMPESSRSVSMRTGSQHNTPSHNGENDDSASDDDEGNDSDR